IGIDRAFEADIGAVIGGDDGLGALEMLDGLEDRERLDIVPAIIKALAGLLLEAASMVGLRAATANALGIDQFAPRQIGIAAATELFQGFERGGLIKGHEGISCRTAQSNRDGRTRPEM